MKYILLDTNIILDMLIDRKKQVSSSLLESFIKLLDFNEINLIVPEIVKVETKRNLKKELDVLGRKIDVAKKSINDLYGIVVCQDDMFDVSECKKNCKKELNIVSDLYNSNKEKYLSTLDKTIDKVFEHKNSILIECDEFLTKAVIKRQIYKRAPFHIISKESYGDGLITEILINIKRYIKLNDDDVIIFVTGNYKDFCVSKDYKEVFHDHIIEDFKRQEIDRQIKCINTFGKLIGSELKSNIENAQLTEEFYKELEEEKQIYIDEYEAQQREIYQLTPMGEYEDLLRNDLPNSEFYQIIIEQLDNLNSVIDDFIQNEYYEIFEEVKNCLKTTPISDVTDKLRIVDDARCILKHLDSEIDTTEILCDDLTDIIQFVDSTISFLDNIGCIDKIPDKIDFGDCISFINYKMEAVHLELGKLELIEEEGGNDQIEISIFDHRYTKISRGFISITYGFYELNDDGGIEDALDDNIEYNCSDIIKTMDDIVNDWEELRNDFDYVCNILKDEFC